MIVEFNHLKNMFQQGLELNLTEQFGWNYFDTFDWITTGFFLMIPEKLYSILHETREM